MNVHDYSILSRLAAVARRLNTRRLKRVGILTYFGFYALVALGLRRLVNRLLRAFPESLRPAPLAPLDATFGLPTSIAWSLTSLAVALLTVTAVAGYSLSRTPPNDADPTAAEPTNDEQVADESAADD